MKYHKLLSCFILGMLPALGQAATFNVLDHGIVPDGTTNNTQAIKALVAKVKDAGGGTVVFPPGKYLTGSIHMVSNMTLQLDAGSELLYSGDPEDSPIVKSRLEGTTVYVRSPLIWAENKENISITGRGTINGVGENWWWRTGEDPAREHIAAPWKKAWFELRDRIQEGYKASKEDFSEAVKFLRPSLIQFYECSNILVEGVYLLDSPMWMLHPIYSENIVIRGVSFSSHGPNGDGIDVDSCRNVRISDCYFDTEDDCIVIKSGRDLDGRSVARPTEFVTITNCVMYRGHGGVVIGSEMSGDVRNITASNIICNGTDRGIRLKTGRGRGGVMEYMRFDNWVILDAPHEAIQISTAYVNLPEEPKSERTPTIRNIAISNVTIRGAQTAVNIAGLEEQDVLDIRLSDIDAIAENGLRCSRAKGVELHDIRMDAETGPAFLFTNSSKLHLDNLSANTVGNEPIVSLNNTQNVWLTGSRSGAKTFVQVLGADTRDVLVSHNELEETSRAVAIGSDVPEGRVTER